jgi:hypothetical protein
MQPEQGQPAAGPPQPPPMPWTPFTPLPTDDEPQIAAMRRRRLEKLIDGAKFEGMDPTWQQVALTEYARMRQVEAAAAQAAAQAQLPASKQPKPQEQPGGPPA